MTAVYTDGPVRYGVIPVDTSTPAGYDSKRDAILRAVDARLILTAPLSELRFIAACFARPTP